MPGIYRRRKTWWISYNVAKKRRRESLETKDERLARKKLRKLEYEHSTGNLGPPLLNRCTFEQRTRERLDRRPGDGAGSGLCCRPCVSAPSGLTVSAGREAEDNGL